MRSLLTGFGTLLVLCACAPMEASSPPQEVAASALKASADAPLFEVVVDKTGAAIAYFPEPGSDGVIGRFIHTSGLTAGLGSNPIGLDRGLGDFGRIILMRKVGPKFVVEQENWTYRASADSAEEKTAVRNSFAASILWAGNIKDGAPDGKIAVDMAGFFMTDILGVAGALREREQGSYSLDQTRSFVAPDGVLLFPDNVEIDAVMTFSNATPGDEVDAVAADGRSATLTQHHSFVRLPEAGYQTREFDARTGAIGVHFYDFSAPLAGQVRRGYARRFRLERVDPTAVTGPVKKPIVIYVDRGAPEPIRSALVEGASWWADAFEAAGFEDGYRVEILPEGIHPMDVRYSTIQWVHRQTRGWSYGGGVYDPRTGEMLKARVILGSQRVRQDRMIFEGLAGTQDTGSGGPADPIEMSLARIRQLSAHEVGHTLGFAHNFAASANDRASVMDYPAPFVRPAADGGLDFSEVYGVGVGAWDIFATRWLYSQFPDGVDARAALEGLVDDAYAAGLRFVDDAQGRSPGSAHPFASVWDNGADPVATLVETLEVRARALAAFGERSLKPDEPVSRLRQVIAPIYLYHRYQTAAAAKWIGGYEFRHARPGDEHIAGEPVPAGYQRTALRVLLRTLDPAVLDLPDNILDMLTPSLNARDGEGEGEEHISGLGGAMFDLLSAADAAASLPLQVLLHPARLARVVETHRRDPEALGLNEMFQEIEDAVFSSPDESRHQAIARIVQSRYISMLMDVALDDDGAGEAASTADARLSGLKNRIGARLLRGDAAEHAHRTEMIRRIDAHLARSALAVATRNDAPRAPQGSPIGAGSGEECWFCDL